MYIPRNGMVHKFLWPGKTLDTSSFGGMRFPLTQLSATALSSRTKSPWTWKTETKTSISLGFPFYLKTFKHGLIHDQNNIKETDRGGYNCRHHQQKVPPKMTIAGFDGEPHYFETKEAKALAAVLKIVGKDENHFWGKRSLFGFCGVVWPTSLPASRRA